MDRSTLSVIEQLEASIDYEDIISCPDEDTISCPDEVPEDLLYLAEDYQEEACSSDSDSEYVPRICVKTGGAFKTQLNLDDLSEINMEDLRYDFEDMEEEKEEETTTDASPSPFLMKVLCEDGSIGVPASIVYHSSLKQHLDIPTRACTAMDRTTKQRCGAPKPFEEFIRERGTAAVVEWELTRGPHQTVLRAGYGPGAGRSPPLV
ncbi:unnamed protein product [Leuciscus chuanchicus]